MAFPGFFLLHIPRPTRQGFPVHPPATRIDDYYLHYVHFSQSVMQVQSRQREKTAEVESGPIEEILEGW